MTAANRKAIGTEIGTDNFFLLYNEADSPPLPHRITLGDLPISFHPNHAKVGSRDKRMHELSRNRNTRLQHAWQAWRRLHHRSMLS